MQIEDSMEAQSKTMTPLCKVAPASSLTQWAGGLEATGLKGMTTDLDMFPEYPSKHGTLACPHCKGAYRPHSLSESTGALSDVLPQHPGGPGDREAPRCCHHQVLWYGHVRRPLSLSLGPTGSEHILSPLEDPSVQPFLCCQHWVG